MNYLLILLLSFTSSLVYSQSKTFKNHSVRLFGETRVPFKRTFQGTVVGGLSGIDKGRKQFFYIISDDKNEHSYSRIYKAKITLTDSSCVNTRLVETQSLKDKSGSIFDKDRVDPEAVRIWKRKVVWSSEGNKKDSSQPELYVSKMNGKFIRKLALPPSFRYLDSTKGLRANSAIEGITIVKNTLWICNEEPLIEDGPVATTAPSNSNVRLTSMDLRSGKVLSQVAYLLDPVSVSTEGPKAEQMNSVSEILAVNEKEILVMERSYTQGYGNTVKVFLANLPSGTDIRYKTALKEAQFKPVEKTLLIDFSSLGVSKVDNVEGMTFGPRLKNGNRTLIFVSDDNFSSSQITQIIAVELIRK